MGEFCIRIRSFQEIQDFIALATAQPFHIELFNDHQSANATSFMGLVSLDLTRPSWVRANCTETEYFQFCQKAMRFAAN